MRFQYFTFFLNPVGVLFEDKRDKNTILAEILTRKDPLSFDHRSTDLAYVFSIRNGDYILAKIGKKSILKRNLPPNQEFEETSEENWPCCKVLINLSKDSNKGQKIAFEYKTHVFENPNEQLKSFAEAVNMELMTAGYALAINPITKEHTFWELVKDFKGKIEEVRFTFNAPNLFNLKNSLNADLKEAQEEFKMTKATITFENPEGNIALEEDNKFVQEGVEYITKGGGEYSLKIKGKGRKIISTRSNIETKTFEFEDLEIRSEHAELLNTIGKQIFE